MTTDKKIPDFNKKFLAVIDNIIIDIPIKDVRL
jgi:hypothetical protein